MANLALKCYVSQMQHPVFPNVTSFMDRHGRERWRFRRSGYKTHSFRSALGTPEFKREYEWAITQGADAPKPRPIRHNRQAPISIASLRGVEIIYFVGPKRGPVKIGRTNDLESRLLRLQTGNHEALYLYAAMPGGEAEEAALHMRFEQHRLRGEWFSRTPELTALIRQNRLGPWRTDLLVSQNIADSDT